IALVVALGTVVFATNAHTAQHNKSGPATQSVVVATYAAKPEYPYVARSRHMVGSGTFLVHIRADGTVRLVETVQSTGHRELDDSTIAAFQRWRFRVDRPTKVEIPITYSMGNVRTGSPIPTFTR
ncbi:MAG TPA: energy transducer TonB, partial [Chthoniobacterales bacterium]|nr:energy transducer TonB [Chthoniobacterales bacterium]